MPAVHCSASYSSCPCSSTKSWQGSAWCWQAPAPSCLSHPSSPLPCCSYPLRYCHAPPKREQPCQTTCHHCISTALVVQCTSQHLQHWEQGGCNRWFQPSRCFGLGWLELLCDLSGLHCDCFLAAHVSKQLLSL